MTIEFFAIQIIGFLGTILFFLSYQCRSNKTLFRVQFLSYLCYTVHLLLLGATTGGISYILNTVRSFCLSSEKHFLKSRWACGIICALQLVTLMLTWDGWWSILPVTANIAATIGGYTFSARKIRLTGMLINSPLWILYDIAVGSYAGILDLYATSEGIVIINELPVESYLCKVVPSEMPASYQKEALKAQAVCARNYAERQMEDYAYPEYQAHVNDSTDYQVYNNSAQQDASTEAVRETAGEVLKYKGNIVTTYYYSTSCGKTTTMKAWGTSENESNGYLQSVEVKDKKGDYEKSLPWYRWEADIDQDILSTLLAENVKKNIGTVQSLEVTKTGPGGVALQIKAVGDKGSITVDTENKIRKALGGNGYEIKKQDGTVAQSGTLLPSAFFKVKKAGNIFKITGGGYGHGIGMSQNGANEMAKTGKNYQEILQMFYPGTTIEK